MVESKVLLNTVILVVIEGELLREILQLEIHFLVFTQTKQTAQTSYYENESRRY